MSNVAVQKANGSQKGALPIFAEIEKRMEDVRQRAFSLFQSRGGEVGRDWDDWFAAERDVFGWAKAELTEKDDACEIQVQLPGFEAKELSVTATPEEIVVRGSTKHIRREAGPSQGDEDVRVVRNEFGSSEVYRRFVLPRPALVDKVTARLEKGILHISAPCPSESKPVSGAKRVSTAMAAA